MKKNAFEMGANFEDTWSSNNTSKPIYKTSYELKEPNKHQLHFAKEKRRGKTITIIKPFYLSKDNLKNLLKVLKKKLGTGGTIRDNNLEFQGDIPGQLRLLLEEMSYGFKN